MDTSKIELDISADYTVRENVLYANWDDNHKSKYDLEWIYDHFYPKLESKRLMDHIPTTPYNDIINGKGLEKWLMDIYTFGLGFVTDVPKTVTDTHLLSQKFGGLRNTHYGSMWSFTSDLKHKDTAYTNFQLEVHTDTTYFTEPVGLQLFHVIEHEGMGGESIYVDGIHTANEMRKVYPWAFDALCSIELSAQSIGDANVNIKPYLNYKILNTSQGVLKQVRYNNSDRTVVDPNRIEEFYKANLIFNKMLKERQRVLKLHPGTAVMIDNWRMLHGRNSFTGKRTACGSYHQYDDFLSKLRLYNKID